jgi:hypothetical protein
MAAESSQRNCGHRDAPRSLTVTANGTIAGKSTITAYTLPEASSMQEALELMRGHPHFHTPKGFIEVLEALAIPGMWLAREPN